MFDDILGPRKEVLNTPVDEVDEKNAMPPDKEIEFEPDEINLDDLLMEDEEADDKDGNTLGDPWSNVPQPPSVPSDPDDVDSYYEDDDDKCGDEGSGCGC